MRSKRRVWVFCLLLLPYSIQAQQTAVTSAQGSLILQQAFGVLAGSTSIADVTLTGMVRRIAGSDNETGSVELNALASGQSLTTGTYPSGRRSEVRSISSTGIAIGSWSGPDGVVHSMAGQNLVTDATWFFPAFTLGKLLASPTSVTRIVGQETNAGVLVTHLMTSQAFPDFEGDSALQMQHLSQMDLFLDAKLLLPVALDFSIHPDNNLLLDIPVEIRFSDYRAVSGAQIPFHIQKYLNNSLILDIQIQTATLNSGLAITAFTLQ